MDILKPVWLSSINHLNEFINIFEKNPWWRKYVLSNYDLPKDYPYVSYLWNKLPIIFFASGKLIYEQNSVKFTPVNKNSLWSYHNLKNDTGFELTAADDLSLDRYHFTSPMIKYYSIDWIRIKTAKNIFQNDFLICRGGLGPSMKEIIKATDDLFEILVEITKTGRNRPESPGG